MPAPIPIGAEPGSTGQKIATLALHEPAAASPADLVTYSLPLPVGSQSKQLQQSRGCRGDGATVLVRGYARLGSCAAGRTCIVRAALEFGLEVPSGT